MKNPRSDFYMGDVVRRTAKAALRKRVRREGMSDFKAMSRAHHMGLDHEGAAAEIEAIRQGIGLDD